ncbi:S1 RNA-binding domain-containing protein [Prochlorococcus sp. MIT 1341]|uniref:S1 RNA-binding domain-containing protein n=1 Tax=Prochlorococcus sp. MIT 1341 TaxID=3096221 RepID=UPI002A7562C7|nr:S1 RNA-binding domain-containing protein [Prochlorococcus sp. MIT 1341]
MTESGGLQPNRPKSKATKATPPRKPPQVMHIRKREEQEEHAQEVSKADQEESLMSQTTLETSIQNDATGRSNPNNPEGVDGLTMADLLGPVNNFSPSKAHSQNRKDQSFSLENLPSRSVDDFDFDEEAFLAALDQNEPVGLTGEIATGAVIGVESDGVYVDIGGKAPGFMPKNECSLGVITNLKEKFPKGLELEVLVTREQNADGMVTISCRALALRKSWEKVRELEKEAKVVKVIVNGFNRGGVTCDLEGLRGFIPRSQLVDGANHDSLVGKNLVVTFLEVNPDNRKLVLSEKKAALAIRLGELEIGQLIEGQIVAVKPYGFFVDLGGVSGLLHQSMITGGSLRSLREVFDYGDKLKALITELDLKRGRIGLNTALLESMPGEILLDKEKVLSEAEERAQKARSLLSKNKEEAAE